MKKRYLWLVKQSFRTLRHRKLRHRPWWRTITRPLFERRLWVPCRDSVAIGLSIGMFFAVMPMPGQAIVAALLSMKARGNIPFAIGACFLSNPFTNVPIWAGQIYLGNLIHQYLPVPMPSILYSMEKTLPGVGSINAGSFIVGSVVSGCLLAAVTFLLVHLFAALLPQHLPARKGQRIPRAHALPQIGGK